MKPNSIINRDPPDPFQVQGSTGPSAKKSPFREIRKNGIERRNQTTTENNFTLAELVRVLALAGFGTIVFVLWYMRSGIKWFFGKVFKLIHRGSRYAGPGAN